ncbi:non-ribosomal peptide synthetase [Streptacidiphilus fuscans]|uniref:Amino acid adenylation domain-containing protein n=1 Tax=Streptacidiphilus fuscans TaxID=2789292 RepID=A0A931B5J1_9ACTN|nr:non-ribosomal peptide synthetase [Streptacidiphilus fuscans]MBF9069817.1 amino acid adenylation domain-containing protein [Streptacidiphilus fuscans]
MPDEGEFEIFGRLSLAQRMRLLAKLVGDPLAGPQVRPSAEQRRMLVLEQTDQSGKGYTLTSAWWIDGPLDVDRFRTCVETVLNREWTLRQRFVSLDGETYQLTSAVPICLEFPDETGTAMPSAAGEIETDVLDDLSGGPIDPMTEPLARVRLRRSTTGAAYLFTLCVHHAAADGSSLSMLLDRISSAYESDSALAAEAGPSDGFVHHLAAQAGYPGSAEHRADLAFWREQLDGLPEAVSFPPVLDGERDDTGGDRRVVFTLTPEEMTALSACAAEQQATLVHVVLAAYHLVLSRFSGAGDMAVGVPTNIRGSRRLRDVVGDFVNTLAIRVRAEAGTFEEHLRTVRDTANEALLHQLLPFDEVTAVVGRTGRSVRGGAVCSAFLSVEPYSLSGFTLGGLPCLDVEPRGLTAPWGDVSFFLQPNPSGGAVGEFVVASDVMDSEITRAAAEHLHDVLRAAPLAAGVPLPELGLRPGASTATGDVTPLGDGPAFSHLAEVVENTPEAVCVRDRSGDLTYAELWNAATETARGLVRMGVRPGDPVAVPATHDRWLVVSLYATLLAGGVYLPVGTTLPEARLREIAAESGAKLVLQPGHTAVTLPGVPDVNVDEARRAGSGVGVGVGVEATLPDLVPHDAAYLLFTSGSTGRPKGVLNSHRSLDAFIRWCLRSYSRQELSSVLGCTPATFDISLFELFAPLAAGGTLVLADDLFTLRNHPLADELTLINTVPSLMKEYLAGWDLPSKVETVNFCGETLPNALAQEVYRRGRSVARVHNLYGPSEDTVFSTVWSVPRGWTGALPIGRPLDNSGATVRDLAGRPVPEGAPGELVLFGAGLADGYLNRPTETAARFVPHEQGVSRRAYRTGDMARMRPDGCLEFLGRADRQIKLRGLRIEPGEVELAVMALEPVTGCAVVLADLNGEQTLIAYVAHKEPAPDDPAGLGEPQEFEERVRAHVARRLPRYMVPARVITVPAVPLTSSGKLDLAALPRPSTTAPLPSSGATTPLEEVICGLFAEVLRLPAVDPADGFFALGGTSLGAMRLASRLRDVCGREVSAATLFRAPTPRELAHHVRQSTVAEVGDIVLIRSGEGPALVCLPPASGNTLCYSALAAELPWTGPVYVVTAPGLADDRPMVTSVDDAAEQAWSTVRSAGVDDIRALVGYCFGGTVAGAMARIAAAEGRPVPDLVAVSAERVGRLTKSSEADLIGDYGGALAQAAGLPEPTEPPGRWTLDELLKWADRAGITGPGMTPDELVRGYRTWANNEAAQAFYAAEPIAVPARGLFVGAARSAFDASGQWADVFAKGLDRRRVDVTHDEIMRVPHVGDVAALVQAWLEGAR